MERDDEALVRLAQAGDAAAEELLCVRYKEKVRRIARPYFLIGADREDLIQEGMIGLYKAVRDYREGHDASFSSFAEMCITRQMISAIQAARRQKHLPLNSYVSINQAAGGEDRELAGLLGMGEDPEDVLISREAAKDLMESIRELLTPMEKQAMELFLMGMSYQEIAQRMGKGKKSVDNALSRVRQKLTGIVGRE